MRSNPQLVGDLSRVIERECGVYKEYLQILSQERGWLIKFNAEKLNILQKKRQELIDLMVRLNEKRLAIVEKIPGTEGKRLSDIVEDILHPADAKKLRPLVVQLRSLVTEARNESAEFSQVSGFGLNIVNGLLSILWSATQNVIKTYSQKGVATQSYNPTKSRLEGVLKQA